MVQEKSDGKAQESTGATVRKPDASAQPDGWGVLDKGRLYQLLAATAQKGVASAVMNPKSNGEQVTPQSVSQRESFPTFRAGGTAASPRVGERLFLRPELEASGDSH
jgi:hypothetical protein